MNTFKSYLEFMDSEAMKKKRSYSNKSEYKYVWTESDIQKFFEAFAKYGNSPTANKTIARIMGEQVKN